MKNLTAKRITIERNDGSRIILDPSIEVPKLVHTPKQLLGEVNGVTVYAKESTVVDFGTIVLKQEEQPYIVDPEIFAALPKEAVAFVTPDYGDSAIRNAFKVVHAVTQLIAKETTAHAALPPQNEE